MAEGTFAPSIYIGACLGGALGRMIEASLLEDFSLEGKGHWEMEFSESPTSFGEGQLEESWCFFF